jgi:hypothetical protein
LWYLFVQLLNTLYHHFWITVPSSYPGCTLLPDANDVASKARGFLILYAWRFPFTFVNLVVSGLLLGSKQSSLMGLAFTFGGEYLLLIDCLVLSFVRRLVVLSVFGDLLVSSNLFVICLLICGVFLCSTGLMLFVGRY